MFVPALFVSSEKIRHQNKKIIGVKIPFTLVNRQTEKVSNFIGYSWLQNKPPLLWINFPYFSNKGKYFGQKRPLGVGRNEQILKNEEEISFLLFST